MSSEVRRRRRRRRILGIRVPRRSSRREASSSDPASRGPAALAALRRHPRVTLAVLAVVVVAVGWFGLSVKGMVDDLRQAERQAEVARLALTRGDTDGARRAIEEFTSAAGSARDRADSPLWGALSHLPLVGDDVRVVRSTSEVLADLGEDGLGPLLEVADAVSAGTFSPVDGRLPIDLVRPLVGPLGASEQAFEGAADRLDRIPASGLIGPVESRFTSLRQLVARTAGVMGSLRRTSELLPRALGGEGRRTYLMVMQNNAESRSSGGLPGSLTLIRADGGRISIGEQRDMASLGATQTPVLPLSKDEVATFGATLGTVGVDATLTPDIPRAADLIRARWVARTGEDIDGVLFVDPVVGSYLLRATGPVPLADGTAVGADDVVRRVENEVYAGGDTATQSRFQDEVARVVFDRFVTGAADPVTALGGLVAGVEEGRVRLRLFGEADQAVIAGTRIAGEFVDAPTAGRQVGFYVNDAGPTKMQYYLQRESSAAVRSCRGGVQDVVASLTLRNATPPGAEDLPDGITGEFFPGNRTDPGQQFLIVYVTSPRGGRIESILVDGQVATGQQVGSYAGRQVAAVSVLLDPGDSRSIQVRTRTGPDERGDVRVDVSPGAQPGTQGTVVPTACDPT